MLESDTIQGKLNFQKGEKMRDLSKEVILPSQVNKRNINSFVVSDVPKSPIGLSRSYDFIKWGSVNYVGMVLSVPSLIGSLSIPNISGMFLGVPSLVGTFFFTCSTIGMLVVLLSDGESIRGNYKRSLQSIFSETFLTCR